MKEIDIKKMQKLENEISVLRDKIEELEGKIEDKKEKLKPYYDYKRNLTIQDSRNEEDKDAYRKKPLEENVERRVHLHQNIEQVKRDLEAEIARIKAANTSKDKEALIDMKEEIKYITEAYNGTREDLENALMVIDAVIEEQKAKT